ncbi:MAG: serine hydrolase domain-containing protein, partial [Bacteroidota bacterium]
AFSLSAQSNYETELRPYIEKQMKKRNIQGLSIALVDDQEVVWAEGFGYANVEQQQKADENTIYRVGSISKIFTAMAIMQLVEDGKLDLDAPVSDYIPEFKPKSHFDTNIPITTRHLLTHQSGLPSDIMADFFMNGAKPFTEIVSLLNAEYLCEQPNTVWSYSNAAYSLLGTIVERVSEEDFFRYTRTHLLDPMEMKQSHFGVLKEMEAAYSMGYINKGEAYDEPAIRDVPAGMLHASVADMGNFMKMLNARGAYGEEQILSSSALTKMLEEQPRPELDYDRKMGLCFFLSDRTDYDFAGGFAGHGGDTRAYHAQFAWLPEQKLSVVILTNSERGGSLAGPLRSKILLEALKNLRELEREEKEEAEEDESPKIKVKPKADDFLAAQAGYYALGGYPVKFDYNKGRLSGKVQSINAEIVPNNQGSYNPRVKIGPFGLPQKNQFLAFDEVENQNVIKIFTTETEALFAVKVEPNPIPEVWAESYGSYLLVDKPDPDEAYNFMVKLNVSEQDGLILIKSVEHEGEGEPMSFGVNPISDDMARVYGLGRNCGGTIFRYEKDGKRYIRVWGLEFEEMDD